jgi:ABC-2 type transport system permease protein
MKWITTRNQNRQHNDQAHHGRTSAHLPVLFVVLICLLVTGTFLINLVVIQLGQRYDLTADLTANTAYKVGDETKKLLQNLEKDVDIYVLATQDAFGGSSYFLQAQHMIEAYPQLSSRVSLSYVDYVFDPTFASRFPDLTLSQGNVLVVSSARVKQLQLSDLFNYTYADGVNLRIESSRAEEAVTSAILNVIREEKARVANLTGNGMADMPVFIRLLTDNNYEVSQVNLTMDALDDTYNLALLLGPRIDLSEDALRKLDAFLYNDGAYGKTLLYTADVAQESLPNLETFLKEWGIIVGGGAVFETTAERTYQYQPYYPVAEYVDQTFRDQLIDPSSPVLMPLSRPLELVYETRGTNFNEVLLQFTETSGVRPPEAVDSFTIDQAKQWGPLPALVLASKRIYGTTGMTQFRSNLVLSASTAMLDTFSIQNTSLSNSEYLLNLFNTLCERTDVVNIQPKSLAGNTLAITTAQVSRLGVLLAGVLPLSILATGIVIWFVRRYQ